MRAFVRTKYFGNRSLVLLLTCKLFVDSLPLTSVTKAQVAKPAGIETTTADRLEESGWWPTKTTHSRESFAGTKSCARCHTYQSSTQPLTPMGMASRRPTESEVFQKYPVIRFIESPHTFSIRNSGEGTDYSVTDGVQTATQQLKWAFGAGDYGQTFLYQKGNSWYESEVSFYKNLGGLDLTTGHAAKPDASAEETMGKRLRPEDAQHCFQCHTTLASSSGQFDPQYAIGGLGCEACHGPGRAHVASMTDQLTGSKPKQDTKAALVDTHLRPSEVSIMNPGKLSAIDSVDFCGACHRTWSDIAFSSQPDRGLYVVRFQPYRLEKSKCWGKNGDARITCIACHDPHRPLERNASVYDDKCVACHTLKTGIDHAGPQASEKPCPVSTKQCTTCHMPKYNIASMHGDFTDHWIRIVRAGTVFPE